MLSFDVIEISNHLKNLTETEVHKLVSLAFEVFVSDKDCVI